MEKERIINPEWNFLHFSPSRGNLPILYPQEFQESQEVDVLTNGGAQLMNSELYARRYVDRHARDIVDANEEAVAAIMLAYSQPQDRFIFRSKDALESKRKFSIIADSYENIGISVTRNFVSVTSIDSYQTDRPVLPNVLSKEVVRYFGNPSLAEPNIRFYRKDQHQQLWKHNTLPTPRTLYVPRGVNGELSMAIASLGGYQTYVVNSLDGSGGYNIFFPSYNELASSLEKLFEDQDNSLVQIQGELPLTASPCIIANLSDYESQIVAASYQRFKNKGVYGGNKWSTTVLSELAYCKDTYLEAFESLRKEGVRGQVNIDLLLIDPLYAEYGGIKPVILREANIRPAGSSVLGRLKEAKLNGEKVERIHLANGIPAGNIAKLSALNNKEQSRYAHVYNCHNDRVAIAFLGTAGVSEESLDEFEEETKSTIL